MNQAAAIQPIGTDAMVDQAWEDYRALLFLHIGDPDRFDDSDRRKARAGAFKRFEDAFNSYNCAQDRRK